MQRTIVLLLALVLHLAPAAAQKKITVPLEPAAWETGSAQLDFTTYRGKPALRIDDGGQGATGSNIVRAKDVSFANGTIDYDVALAKGSIFSTVYFRMQDDDNTEHVYLRSFWADNPNMNSGVQYAAVIDGVNLWDLSHEYQSGADFQQENWNHVRIVVRDRQALVYVNDMDRPAIYVPILDGTWNRGGIGFDGKVWISNVVITPDATPGLQPGAGFDPVHNDTRYLRNWQVTQPIDFPGGRSPISTDAPNENTQWAGISAERHGLVNLSRRFGATPQGERRLVWLKTTVTAAEAMRRTLHFGFSDEVYVYLNGRPAYVDQNPYNTPAMKAPRGRLSTENCQFDLELQEGDNEILIGVANYFFGWGIVARWDDAAGLRY